MGNITTEEEAAAHSALPVEERASIWISWLEEGIARIEEIPGVDINSAVRGKIVGEICGDAVNGVSGVSLLTRGENQMTDKMLALVTDGVQETWLQSTMAIERFRNRLPELTVQAFQGLFEQYKPFLSNVVGGKLRDPKVINDIATGLFEKYKQIEANPPGMGVDDIDYANGLETGQ